MQVDHFSDPNASARIIRPLTAPADAAPSREASARPKPSADRVEHRFLGVRRMMVEIETVVWLDRRNQRRKARQIGERMICADGKLWTISPDGVSRAPQSRTLGALYVHLDECRDDASFPNPVIEAAGRNLDRASVRGMSCRTTVSKQQFDAAVKHGQAMNVHPRRKRRIAGQVALDDLNLPRHRLQTINPASLASSGGEGQRRVTKTGPEIEHTVTRFDGDANAVALKDILLLEKICPDV